MIDVDRFKPFNDHHYGHPEGDRCLAAVAGAIREAVRGGLDVAGRYGGEEFLVMLPAATEADALAAAERIRRAVENLAVPHAAGEFGIVTVSVGVAVAGIAGPRPSVRQSQPPTRRYTRRNRPAATVSAAHPGGAPFLSGCPAPGRFPMRREVVRPCLPGASRSNSTSLGGSAPARETP